MAGRIGDALQRQAAARPEAPALEDGGAGWSFGELAARARGFAAALAREGVAPGDRVVLFADKRPDTVAALYGIWEAGAIAVPAHEALRERQLEHVVRDSDAKLLAADPRLLRRMAEGARGGRPVLGTDARAEPGGARVAGPEEAAILYTSGSTGAPKGVLLSHENLCAGARIVSSYLGLDETHRILSVLPFGFDYGLNQLLTAVHVGATLVLQRSTHPADLCRSLREARITGLAGVPPLWAQLLSRHSPFLREAFPDLRYLTNSGGTFPPRLLAQVREHLPHVRIFLMYGLTEAFRSTYLDPSELDRRPGSIGRPIPETEILLLDEAGRPGESGELVHRGPTVALGYWRQPEATARVFRPDPEDPASPRRVVFSGDRARRDAEGFLYWEGRRDTLFKSWGIRVNPDEVESALLESATVDEVAVRPRADETAGTVWVAHVVPRDPEGFAAEAFLSWCRQALPRWQAPVEVRVHEKLPRTASGKIDRQALPA